MFVTRYIEVQIKNHSYFMFFFCIGLFLNFNFSDNNICETQTSNKSLFPTNHVKINPGITVPRAQTAKKLIRPRYYSTELGIREKIFVGVLTTPEFIDSRTIAVNKTVAHLVDKIKYFMSASHRYKPPHSLSNIVGFTDTRELLRPFHIVKYIADGFSQNYDYFFLMKDTTYLNAHSLKYIVNKISVSQNVYLGTRLTESSFCSLDAGILLSNSVITAMVENIDWCVKNSFSDNHSENLGRCIAHSIGLDCQEEIQGQTIFSYRLKHYSMNRNLKELSKLEDFNAASAVYPVTSPTDMYTLHAYYSKLMAVGTLFDINKLVDVIQDLQPSLPETYNDVSWPVGHRPGNSPSTRFDVPKHKYFNLTHKYFHSDYFNVDELTSPEKADIENVVDGVIAKARHEHGDWLKYRRLLNGYSMFDLSRGLDYTLDVGFKDLTTGKEIIKRYEVCKPLGKVEVLPIPYVTENSRITILLPIQEHEMNYVQEFINMYTKNVMNHHQKVFLMLILLYKSDSPSKGTEDVFLNFKNLALKVTKKYHNENNKIAWLSVRLPNNSSLNLETDQKIYFAIVDLALRKVGVESLVLVLDIYVDISVDFLNRVRLNTIMGSQIFNVVPFRQYNPAISLAGDKHLDVHKTTGQFDSNDYKYISFYGKEYVTARLHSVNVIPLVRVDKDIEVILNLKLEDNWNIFKLFVTYLRTVHCIRATDPGLKVKYHENTFSNEQSLTLIASKTQLAKLILTYGEGDFL